MAWRYHKPTAPATSASGSKPASAKDESESHLEAALAKIQSPPPMSSMVGAVIHADGSVEGGRSPSTSPASPPPPPATQQKTAPSRSVAPAKAAAKAAPPPEPALPKRSSSVPAAHAQKIKHHGPLDKKELLALGDFLKQQKRADSTPSLATPIIAPTAPDPDAAIPALIAEQKKTLEAKAAEEDAKKWHVTKVDIHDRTINMKKMYRYGAVWIGAVPLAVVMYYSAQALGDSLQGTARQLFFVAIYVIAGYVLVGWIPLVLEYLKAQKG
ncbi:hypothetical protein CSA80_00555 [Candidatus Saccharibacteria bacterium]|nr:MAG: hypothetical protein CR973_00835 [Candidatus Saccharibacteria bacterium]PID99246.1 MAG: hypothetical protein CSA80_00555 [Candidatus Saccharibacteria bacterium]